MNPEKLTLQYAECKWWMCKGPVKAGPFDHRSDISNNFREIAEILNCDLNAVRDAFIGAVSSSYPKENDAHNEEPPLRQLEEFDQVVLLHRKMGKPSEPHPSSSKKLWDLYIAKKNVHNPPFFIVDKDDLINSQRRAFSIEALSEHEICELFEASPNDVRSKIINSALNYDVFIDKNAENEYVARELEKAYLIYKTILRLRNPSSLRDRNWPLFVDNLVSFKIEKDERLKAVHKTHLLRGLNMLLNPHSIQSTNSGTGKSTFYDVVGLNFGRVTPKTFQGYAKSPDEIYPGTVHESDLPINIDQIESQYANQIVRFMFNILEMGRDRVGGGSTQFTVRSTSTFNFAANPIGFWKNPAKSFANLLKHFSLNPAIGRRLGIIVYGNDFKIIKTKISRQELEKWHENLALFRAVEEYCRSKLKAIIDNEVVWKWLNEDMEFYHVEVTSLIEDIDDHSVRDLIQEHAAGAHVRIRAAALYATIAEHLAEIALEEHDVKELIEDAQEKLHTYIKINMESFTKIAEAWTKEKASLAKAFFESQPEYLKEILSAIELWRRSEPEEYIIDLEEIPYQPSSKNYRYFSKCINLLSRRKRIEELTSLIQDHFKIDLTKQNGKWQVALLDSKLCPYIEPLGTLSSNSSISSFRNHVEIPTNNKNKSSGAHESTKTTKSENKGSLLDDLLPIVSEVKTRFDNLAVKEEAKET